MDPNQKTKKRFLFVVYALLLIVMVGWFWHFLHTGKIIITTNSPDRTISLSLLDSQTGKDATKKPVFTGRGRLSANVSTGLYLAVVEGSSRSSRQLIMLSSHKTLRYEIDPTSTRGVEPVSYSEAQDVSADTSQLIYLQPSGGLYKISSAGLSLFASTTFRKVKWADPTFGIGQDIKGRLYSITDGVVSPLKVPFTYGSQFVNFDVSPSKHTYVSFGSDVYALEHDGSFKKIYSSASSNNLVLGAGDNQVAVADVTIGAKSAKPMLALVDNSGKISKVASKEETLKLVLSPNGRYLISITEASVIVYNSSLHEVGSALSDATVGDARWLSDSQLIYSSKDGLWQYDLSGQRANLIANMPLGAPISGLTLSSDKSYVYLTNLGSDLNNDSAIRRVGLMNQVVPKSIYQLQSIMPLTLGQCQLSLINFIKPTIIVSSLAGESAPQCQQNASIELARRGFDLSTLQVSVFSAPQATGE